MGERLVADLVVERLRAWGVHRVFGYSGDGINALHGRAAAGRRRPELRAGAARGERRAHGGRPREVHRRGRRRARAPRARARCTCSTACTTPSSTTCRSSRSSASSRRRVLGSEYQQEIDLQTLFKDVAAQYVQTVLAARAGGRWSIDRAFRTALATRLAVRRDRCRTTSRRRRRPTSCRTSTASCRPPPEWRRPRVLPQRRRPRARPPTCSTPASGSRCSSARARADAGDEVRAVAERLGAGVTTSLLGKPCVDESLPYSCGRHGPPRHHARRALADGPLRHAADRRQQRPVDRVLPARRARPARCRSTSTAATSATATRSRSASPATPPRRCDALLPLLARAADGAWRDEVERRVAALARRSPRERAALPAEPLNPELVVRALSDAAARRRPGQRRRRLGRLLVRPPPAPAARRAGAPVLARWPRWAPALPYGLAAKLAAPGPAAGRPGRRRRDADERHRRARSPSRDRWRELGRPALRRAACCTTATSPR